LGIRPSWLPLPARAGFLLLAVVAVLVGCRSGAPGRGTLEQSLDLTHGPIVGDVDAHRAVVWGRCERRGWFHAALDSGPAERAIVTRERDFTGKLLFTDLEPATRYGFRAWCETGGLGSGEPPDPARGSFWTAPGPASGVAVRFAFGGDLGGQNTCRDTDRGYAIFDVIARTRPAFFVGLGDMIYADAGCAATGRYGNPQRRGPAPAGALAEFWAHWRYHRGDPHFRAFLEEVPYFAVWDDHEVLNDFGPHHDVAPWRPGVHLMPRGLAAFLDYSPRLLPASGMSRLYRQVRWGGQVELFLLDTRQYRDSNAARDRVSRPKTMLGATQRAWLQEGLVASDARWKIVVSSVPMAVPTGRPDARDGWADGGGATGFERELVELLRFAHDQGVRNLLWITADVHFATGFCHRPIDADPDYAVHELVTGPLSAGFFPTWELDRTLRPERLFLFGPADPGKITTLETALSWFTFGLIEIDEPGTLTASIVNARGRVVYRLVLRPAMDE
jgi:alkaline phosphatase D